MTRYDALLTFHVVGAIVWLGAALTLDLLIYRAERAGDRTGQLVVYAQMEWLANRLFIPASLAVLVFGLALVVDGPWGFGQLWVVLGIIGYALSFLVGILYFKPEGERIGALAGRHGPDHPELDRRMRQINVVGRVELAILFLVVGVMVVKPTGADRWTLAVGGLVAALAFAAGARLLWQIRRAPEEVAPVHA